jgi:hypothetical protein
VTSLCSRARRTLRLGARRTRVAVYGPGTWRSETIMCRGASKTPAICPGRLHRGRVRFGEPFRVRRPNSHADRVRLVVAESQRGSTRTVDLRSGRTNHQLAWPEKGRGNGRERVDIFSYRGDRSFSSEASPTFIVGCLYK